MAEETSFNEKSLRDILYMLFKYKWIIIPIFIISLFITGVKINTTPANYISDAKILVGGRQSDTFELVTGLSGASSLNSEIELLLSRGFAEAVVERVGPEIILFMPEADSAMTKNLINLSKKLKNIINKKNQTVDSILRKEAAINKFRNTFIANVPSRSTIINLYYQGHTPNLAQEILKNIVETYVDKHIELNTTATTSMQFLSEETERLRNELSRSETKLRQFREEIDVVSLPQQQLYHMERIGTLQTEIEQTGADIYVLEATIAVRRGSLDPTLRGSEIELATLNARLNILNVQLDASESQLRKLNESEQRYMQLERADDIQEANYRRFLEGLEQARLAQTLESERISNISIMQEPTLLIKPIKQDKKKTLAVGLFIALVGGIGLAFSIEYFNHTIKSTRDVEDKLSLRSIAAIPTVKNTKAHHLIKKEVSKLEQSIDLSIKELSKNVTFWIYAIQVIRESFEVIKNQIYLAIQQTVGNDDSLSPYILAVTSCKRGEGVSTIATGIAYTIALYEGENVLLVDANMHHPNVDKISGINRPPGLFEMTIKPRSPEISDETQQTLFSAENMQEYMAKIHGSSNVNKLLPSVVKLDYKVIVLDLPSLNEGASVIRSVNNANCVILVIKSEKVRREVVNHEIKKLTEAGANILGVTLNQRRYYIPKWLYNKF